MKPTPSRPSQFGGKSASGLQIFCAGGKHSDCVNNIVNQFTQSVQHVVTI